MDKLDGTSMILTNENIRKISELFPDVMADGKVNFDVLRQILGDQIEDSNERYQFSWHGKSDARRIALTPTTATLRPDKPNSINWEKSENLYIEGDNLEVLKALQKSYHNRIKCIYIDPPYNTGKEFVYPDNYKDNLETYLRYTGQKDAEGLKVSSNNETGGRYHTNWLNMMYPRLKLARNLLKEDGVIFISIDDHESANLKKICDEIFGEENFISDLTVVNNLKGRNDKKYIATANERLLMYVKSDEFEEYGLDLPDDKVDSYSMEDDVGKYRLLELRKRGGPDTRAERPNMYYPFFVDPDSGEVSLEKSKKYSLEALPVKSNGVDGRWRWGRDTALNRLNLLVGQKVQNTDRYNIYAKDYLEQNGELRRIKPKSVMSGAAYSTDKATKSFRALMGDIDFTNPKPVELIQDLVTYASSPKSESIFLDFFSGSATLAHAVIEQNIKDGGNRKFICVQLPEKIDGANQKIKTICDIGRLRIKKVVDQSNIKDFGMRAFFLDSTNIKEWDVDNNDLEGTLFQFVTNIKDNRTEDDLLFEVILKYGIPLTTPIELKEVENESVYSIGMGSLLICFSPQISIALIEGIGRLKDECNPEYSRVVFRDNGFPDDNVKTNAIQILKQHGINEIKTL